MLIDSGTAAARVVVVLVVVKLCFCATSLRFAANLLHDAAF
ncbi:hypothetical protein [Deefgea sp. CFH1-16]|nr:hypothetical protein [Deefgea sp. CFH1-16]